MRKLLVLRASWMNRRTKTMWVNYILGYIIFPLSEHKVNLDNPESSIHPCTVCHAANLWNLTFSPYTYHRGGGGGGGWRVKEQKKLCASMSSERQQHDNVLYSGLTSRKRLEKIQEPLDIMSTLFIHCYQRRLVMKATAKVKTRCCCSLCWVSLLLDCAQSPVFYI